MLRDEGRKSTVKPNLGGVGSGGILAVHVEEGIPGAALQPGQLHDVRGQPVGGLLHGHR